MSREIFGQFAIWHNYIERKGQGIPGHKHHFDHVMVVRKGAVDIVIEKPTGGKSDIHLEEGGKVNVLKDDLHTVIATKDHTLTECWFFHRDHEGNVVPDYNGWNYPYE